MCKRSLKSFWAGKWRAWIAIKNEVKWVAVIHGAVNHRGGQMARGQVEKGVWACRKGRDKLATGSF